MRIKGEKILRPVMSLEQAQDYLYDELALVYQIPRDSVEDYLVERVEANQQEA